MYTFKLWKLALQIFQPRSCQPPATKRLVCIAPYKTTAGGSNTEIFWERSLINLGGSCMIGNLTFTISSYTLPGTKISHPKSAPMKMVFLYIYIYIWVSWRVFTGLLQPSQRFAAYVAVSQVLRFWHPGLTPEELVLPSGKTVENPPRRN